MDNEDRIQMILDWAAYENPMFDTAFVENLKELLSSDELY